MQEVKKLKYFVNGKWWDSKTNNYMDVHDPSTGEIIAKAPQCTPEEVIKAIEAAEKAFHEWSAIPVLKRVQVLYRLRELILKDFDELVELICRENGKVWREAEGEIQKVIEHIELACSTPSLMMGDSLLDTSKGFDTVLYREPLGVFVGIVPFNFPAMIPMGWMMPLCIATGNTFVLKAASMTPMTSMKIAELLCKAGLPDGVVNIITCSRKEIEILLQHPAVKGVTFVGSTEVGKKIYAKATSYGKRIQVLCGAKNHALVLEDAVLEQSARAIINASFGCAGERCMALPVVVVQDSVADKLVSLLKEYAKKLIVGPAYDKKSEMGPLISADHKDNVIKWIEKGIKEGAKLVLDGRNIHVEGFENGYYVGPTILDYVQPEMSVGNEEIFGPVLCIKRVKNFEEGINLINSNPYANGAVIFTQSGYYSREFVYRIHAGMVGVNVGIPVPVGIFPFTGHKDSFFGDLHVLGKDGIKFFTESKCVTTRWFDIQDNKDKIIDTWDGTVIKRE